MDVSSAVDPADAAEAGVVRVGDVLSMSARAIGACWKIFVPVTLVVQGVPEVLGLLVTYLAPHAADIVTEDNFGAALTLGVAGGIGFAVFSVVTSGISQALLLYTCIEWMAGRQVSLARALQVGMRRFGWVIVASVLVGFAAALGGLLCIVPGIIAATALFLSIPIVVAEKTDAFTAISRSIEITSGHRMTIFLCMLSMMPIFVVLAGLSAVLQLASIPTIFVSWPMSMLSAMLFASLGAVLYARIRGIRDKIDVDSLAQVFA